MFTKIVSQLSLSPATVERLAQYARIIQRRQRLYGWAAGVFAGLSLLYGITLVFPPVYASSPTANDLLPGGVSSYESVVLAYDNNTDGFRDAAQLLSIERSDLINLEHEQCQAADKPYITGRTIYSTTARDRSYLLPDETYLYLHDTDKEARHTGWCGTTATGQHFAIMTADGNIATDTLPQPTAPESHLVTSLAASTATASAGDTVSWKLTLTNNTDTVLTEDVWFDTGDMTEYTHVATASDDGIISRTHHGILWPRLALAPEEQRTLTVTTTITTPIDETAQQRHNLNAYNCQILSSFGTTTSVDISCPFTKQIEHTLYLLPPVHDMVGLVAFVTLAIICLVAHLIARFHAKELRIIRTQVTTGGVL